MIAKVALAVLLTCLAPVRGIGVQRQPEEPTASVSGQVVDATTRQPVPGALVRLGTSGTILIQTGVAVQTVTTVEGARYMLADGDGRFLFERVEPGRYVLTTEAPGYLTSGYQQRGPNSPIPEFEIADEQHRRDLTINAWPGGVVTGAIYDDAGDPVVGVQVDVLRDTWVYGQRRLEHETTVSTDDRGVYRVSGLDPGRYVVVVPAMSATVPASVIEAYTQARAAGDQTTASSIAYFREVYTAVTDGGLSLADGAVLVPGNQRLAPAISADGLRVYSTTYYPGTTDPASALAVDVASGFERVGLDLRVELVPAFDLVGRLTSPTEDATNVSLELWPSASARLSRPDGHSVAVTRSTTGGRFRFAAVPAGSYLLRARKIPRAEQVWEPLTTTMDGREVTMTVMRMRLRDINAVTLWAEQPVTVSADTGVLEVPLSRGARFSGRARFDGEGTPPSAAVLADSRVWLTAADGSSTSAYSSGHFAPDGTFVSLEYTPGRYYLYGFPIRGWRLAAATVNGRDALRTPFALGASDLTNVELTYSNRPPLQLTGTVSPPETPALPRGSQVVAFPADYERWIEDGMYPLLSATAATADDGTFRLRPQVSGAYLVAAYEPADHRNPGDPEFIRALARSAVAVTVTWDTPASVRVPTAVIR